MDKTKVHALALLRAEQSTDTEAIRRVHRLAFDREAEGQIVDALRGRGVVHVSLVAEVDHEIVGHILFSPARCALLQGAGLGPMAVVPSYQRQGIGSQLVTRGLEELSARECRFVVVVGHPTFYPRFGFQSAAALGLTCDWDLPPGVFMVNVLDPAAREQLHGHIAYQPEFAIAKQPRR